MTSIEAKSTAAQRDSADTTATSKAADKRTQQACVDVVDLSVVDVEYDEKGGEWSAKMSEIGIEFPIFGKRMTFIIQRAKSAPVEIMISRVANVLRALMNDGIEVRCLHVDTSDVSDPNIVTNNPYYIPAINIPYVINLIPIKQVAGLSMKLNAYNRTDGYSVVTTRQLDLGDHKYDDIFGDVTYNIIKLPPQSFIRIKNIETVKGIGLFDGVRHTFAMPLYYDELVKNEKYRISNRPIAEVNPLHAAIMACRIALHVLDKLRHAVESAVDYNYNDDEFAIGSETYDDSYPVVMIVCRRFYISVCALLESIGQTIDTSPMVKFVYKQEHTSTRTMTIRVVHPEPKKYILDTIDVAVDGCIRPVLSVFQGHMM